MASKTSMCGASSSEDGCLRVYGVGEDGVLAFTEYGIECLIADKRAAGGAPPPIRSTK
jgi:hypothetical protein